MGILVKALRSLSRSRPTSITSSVVLCASAIALIGAAVKVLYRPGGEWRTVQSDQRIVGISLLDPADNRVVLQHPAVIYFYSDECRYCELTRRRLNKFVATGGDKLPQVFAITGAGVFKPAGIHSRFNPTIQVARLRSRNPSLRFVSDVPMMVRTDSIGRVLLVFVGVAGDRELRTLLASK